MLGYEWGLDGPPAATPLFDVWPDEAWWLQFIM